ncbi:MAG: hypothetical protein Q9227_003994 [Pyrenula ochraceoflavens]
MHFPMCQVRKIGNISHFKAFMVRLSLMFSYMSLTRQETWKRQRKFANLMFSQAHETQYWGYPDLEVPRLLHGLLERPQDWSPQLDSYMARILSRCAFATPKYASALCTNAFRLLINISPSGRLSNVLPGAMWMPRWLAWWKVDEEDRQEREEKLYDIAQGEIHDQWVSGKAPPSFTRTYFENKHRFNFPNDLEAAFNVGMSTMAGIHTTSSPLHTFFLAMTHYPEWLQKLQEQIDEVCGDRFPQISDMPSLPILRAIIRECVRWRPAVPTGIPHELQADVVWNKYFLPKGSWVHPMEWSLSRDPDVYPDADNFRPDRWLDPRFPTYKEPLTRYPTLHGHHQFGFGRRICQGVNVVETQSFCVMGGVAWAFNLGRRKNARGIEIDIPENDYHPLLITKPNPFHFSLEVRSEERRQQIVRFYQESLAKDPNMEIGQMPFTSIPTKVCDESKAANVAAETLSPVVERDQKVKSRPRVTDKLRQAAASAIPDRRSSLLSGSPDSKEKGASCMSIAVPSEILLEKHVSQ